jgi:hypothetical protein
MHYQIIRIYAFLKCIHFQLSISSSDPLNLRFILTEDVSVCLHHVELTHQGDRVGLLALVLCQESKCWSVVLSIDKFSVVRF